MLIFKRFRPQDVDSFQEPYPETGCPINRLNTEKIFSGCGDFKSREIPLGGGPVTVFVCWTEGTVAGADAGELLLRPLTDPARFAGVTSAEQAAERLEKGAVWGLDLRRTDDMQELTAAISYGNCAVILPGTAFLCELKTPQSRSVQEPTIEKSVKGGKDAFVESLRVNTALVRSRLRTPRLKLHTAVVGRKSRTDTAVLWIEGAADPALPREVIRRLEGLDVDGLLQPDILDSGLSDCPRSPFPQLLHTERPDRLAQALLDGRAAVLAEGIPLAFIAPGTLPEFMKTGEDGAQHYIPATFLRILRWAALILSLLLPAFYIAISMYHAEMIPTELLLSVIDSKQAVPFSSTTEILGMLLAFDLLQEAGLRLPEPVGQTVSIIGALIVGQSAVTARVISPIAVIVVALAGIAGFTMPSQDLAAALRLSRFAMAMAAAAAGMFGIAAGFLLLLWHVCSLESFGRAYIPTGETRPVLPVRRPMPARDRIRDPSINGGDLRRRA